MYNKCFMYHVRKFILLVTHIFYPFRKLSLSFVSLSFINLPLHFDFTMISVLYDFVQTYDYSYWVISPSLTTVSSLPPPRRSRCTTGWVPRPKRDKVLVKSRRGLDVSGELFCSECRFSEVRGLFHKSKLDD